jgi:pantothenate kinase
MRLQADLLSRLFELSSGPRCLLGIVGAPGSGKSTLATLAAQTLGERAQVVPMDGFHLAQAELERQGAADRKGAPHTFDAAGFAALLLRLKHQPDGEVVYAPDFRRNIEEPVAGALPIFAQTPLVITEGNYLLLEDGAWGAVAGVLDEVWFLNVAPALRLERLTLRHMQFGRSREQAAAWIASNDELNAQVIEASAARAHRQVHWDAAQSAYTFSTR